MNDEFLKSIADVLENARKNAMTAVNLMMVYAYFEIGRIIVEEEQNGKNRAVYDKLKKHSAVLSQLISLSKTYAH